MNTNVAPAFEGWAMPAALPASRAVFVVGSVVFHLGLVFALGGLAARPHAPPSREVSVDFLVMESPAVAPPPALAEPVAVTPPPARVSSARAASAPTDAPTPQVAETPSLRLATSLPTDVGGDLAVATGAGGPGVLGATEQTGVADRGDVNGTALVGDGAAASASPAPAVDRRALLRDWTRAVSSILLERARRHYPRSAIEARREGTVMLSITIDTAGHIAAVAVQTSSGHEVLDEAALATVRDVGDVPAPPEALGWRERAVPMPIVYRVR